MAFCPNCGTPNTDQAEKCVACGFGLAVPKQPAKFKGTIMMSGIKAPGQPAPRADEPAAAPAPPTAPTQQTPAPLPSPPGQTGPNRAAFQKTILGPSGFTPSNAARPSAPSPSAGSDFAQAPTVHGPGPRFTPPTGPSATADTAELEVRTFGAPPPDARDAGATGGRPAYADMTGGRAPYADVTGGRPPYADVTGGRAPYAEESEPGRFGARSAPRAGNTQNDLGGGFGHVDSAFPPPSEPARAGQGKLLAIGGGALLALGAIVAAVLYFVSGDKGDDPTSAEALAWQASISQALAQVSELCSKNECEKAGIFFHEKTRQPLLGEAKSLSPERAKLLSDPAQTKAAMLAGTGDETVATKLGLDPQQCARVVAKAAKVVSCSVPDPSGKPSELRIVHLEGIGSL